MKVNWTLIASIVSALAGVVGTVVTPIWGATLSNHLGDVLQAVSGVLAAIGAWHVSTVAAAKAKAKIARAQGVMPTIHF